MFTRVLILVALVWCLCPFLPLLPFPFEYFYAAAALCLLFSFRYKLSLYGAVVFFALGLGIWQLDLISQTQLPPGAENKIWQGEVKVQHINKAAQGDYAQVQAQIIAATPGTLDLPGKIISLGWPKAGQLQQGQHWNISIKLRRLQGLLNEDSINFTALNLSKNISLNGQVQTHPAPVQRDAPSSFIDRLQTHFKQTLTQTQSAEYTRFYLALALGDTSGLTAQDWQVLQKTGTVHLMAISGFQIGLMASLGFLFGVLLAKPACLLLNRHITLQHWPSRYLPAGLSLLFASFYTYLANFSLPAERAWVACILINGIWLLGLRTSLLHLWLLCFVIALLCHPLAPLNTGFWLSYCAVAALLYLGSKKNRKNLAHQTVEAQWIITLALTIPQLALNIPLSTTGFIANIIIAPWISVVITPLVFILLSLSLAVDTAVGFIALDKAYFIAWWSLEKISLLPATLWWPSHALTLWDYVLASLASLLLLLPRCLGFFYLGAVLMWLALLCPRQKNTGAELRVFDAGQGLAVLIKTTHHTVLFDTGPSFSSRFNAGTHILSPYLIAQGIHDIDIFISRDNAEHAGGLRGLKQFNWGTLTTGEPLAEHPNAQLCHQGLHGQWDFIQWEVIAPVSGIEDYSRSCALKLTIGSRSIYLFGDISSAQQRALLKQIADYSAYIVLAPGQGAKNQHVKALAEQLKPRYVVFSNGVHNRYHHPHTSAVTTYQQLGTQSLVTAQLGALQWYWPNEDAEPQLTTQWPLQQKYWYPIHATNKPAHD